MRDKKNGTKSEQVTMAFRKTKKSRLREEMWRVINERISWTVAAVQL
jgi:hypothetical protein